MLSFVNIFQLTTIRFCVILVSSETHFTIPNEKDEVKNECECSNASSHHQAVR